MTKKVQEVLNAVSELCGEGDAVVVIDRAKAVAAADVRRKVRGVSTPYFYRILYELEKDGVLKTKTVAKRKFVLC